MSKNRATIQMLEGQLEHWQQAKQHAEWTKKSYAERRQKLTQRLIETQGMLDALESSYASADATIAEAEKHIAANTEQLHYERFGSKLDRLVAMKEEVERLERQLRAAGQLKEGTACPSSPSPTSSAS